MPKLKPWEEEPEPGETKMHEKRESKSFEESEDKPKRMSPVKAKRRKDHFRFGKEGY